MSIGGKFFEELRELILRKVDYTELLIPHYENLLEYQDVLAIMLSDVEDNPFSVGFSVDGTGGYTDGYLTVVIADTNRHYRISLRAEDRMTGYCMCEPTDEGYNENHHCNGVNCDWYAPSFEVELVTYMGGGSFDGYQHQLWEKEKKWEEYNKELKERRVKSEIQKKLADAKEYTEYAKELQEEVKELTESLKQG